VSADEGGGLSPPSPGQGGADGEYQNGIPKRLESGHRPARPVSRGPPAEVPRGQAGPRGPAIHLCPAAEGRREQIAATWRLSGGAGSGRKGDPRAVCGRAAGPNVSLGPLPPAHYNPMAGHMGYDKTLDRIMAWVAGPAGRGAKEAWCAFPATTTGSSGKRSVAGVKALTPATPLEGS